MPRAKTSFLNLQLSVFEGKPARKLRFDVYIFQFLMAVSHEIFLFTSSICSVGTKSRTKALFLQVEIAVQLLIYLDFGAVDVPFIFAFKKVSKSYFFFGFGADILWVWTWPGETSVLLTDLYWLLYSGACKLHWIGCINVAPRCCAHVVLWSSAPRCL